jgi:TPR repeat protein
VNALSGSVGTRNDLAAVDYFRRSAQKNYGPAQVVLGYLYDTELIVVRDSSQAADWYRKAADAGDPLAQWLLGRLYVLASGLPREDAAAQKWLTLSANRKNPFAAHFWEAYCRSATTQKLRSGFVWPPREVFRRRNTLTHGL